VVLHVFDAQTIPGFWDQHAHAGHAWTQEFLARNCALPGARLELAWSRRLQPGRVLSRGVPSWMRESR
jgi:hypothetical protein